MTGWLKLKLMGLITFINAAIGVTLGGLLYTIWPDHYFKWYPSIPIFYWVMAIVMTYILDRKKRKRRCDDYRFHGSPFLQVHPCRCFPVALCRTGQRKFENVRLHPDAFLFYLFGIGNVYGLSVREEKNEKREKGK